MSNDSPHPEKRTYTVHQLAAFSYEIQAESKEKACERMNDILRFVDHGDFYRLNKEVVPRE